MEENSTPSVCVMMATYNGERYIEEQINSILEQKHVRVRLIIRDDGSSDETLNILRRYEKSNGVTVITGENLGPADNFYRLLHEAAPSDYYAWSDQDDIWDEDKLMQAIALVKKEDEKKPILYLSASRTINANKEPIGVIGTINPYCEFGRALIHSKAQGATFVFNNQLLEIAKVYTPEFGKFSILHDAWLHKVCLATGGIVVFDSQPHMSYRIHDRNVMARISTEGLFMRLKASFSLKSQNCYSNIANELLLAYRDMMPSENVKLAYTFANYRRNFIYKLKVLFSSKIRTNNIKENLRFKILVMLNKA